MQVGNCPQKDAAFIGTCGFHCWSQGTPAKAEIGFDLAKNDWGHGCMREALQPVIEFGFTAMKLNLIEAT